MNIRKIKKKEYTQLRSVWCEVFDDDPIFVDELYYSLQAEGYTVEDEGQLHSFLTLFNAGEINDQQVQVSYAICTKPESRNKGYAGELVKYVRDQVLAQGDISLICPAEDSLVLFYGKLGYDPGLFVKELITEANELPLKVELLDAAEYKSYREDFLADVPHVILRDEFISFIKNDSVNAQGLLLVNGGDAICTLDYGTDEEMGLSELIVNPILASRSSEIAEQIAGGLASLFEVKTARFRSPTRVVYTNDSGNKYSKGSYIQAMIAGNADGLNVDSMLPYYGFPMD